MATAGVRLGAVPAGLRAAPSKVPAVTAWFWAIKVLTTGMGEATSDFLVHTINPVIAVGFGFAGLLAALLLQFLVRHYVTWIYWLAVTMVAVFGTMEADVLHVALGVPYAVSVAGFAVALAVIFLLWHASEKTLSIHSIRTRRRECFYWATVMATFALGTAAGDLTAYSLGLGYLASGVMFAVVIAIPAAGYWLLRRGPVLCFWSAYIVTRPLGASFADWLGIPHSLGGLGLGRGRVALTLTLIIAAGVSYLMVSGRETADGPADPRRRAGFPAGRPADPARWAEFPAARAAAPRARAGAPPARAGSQGWADVPPARAGAPRGWADIPPARPRKGGRHRAARGRRAAREPGAGTPGR